MMRGRRKRRKEVGKQKRYGEENLDRKMKKDAGVRNGAKKDAEVRNDARMEVMMMDMMMMDLYRDLYRFKPYQYYF